VGGDAVSDDGPGKSMSWLRRLRGVARFKGLSSKIYVAFLVTAVAPVMVAGLVGISYSLNILKNETLHHLDREVSGRAAGMGRFFDQVTSELMYLGSSSVLVDVANDLGVGRRAPPRESRARLEREYAAFARAYPYIYQVRFLSARGQEVVRVDRRDGRLWVVPEVELQDKSDRYYVQEGMSLEPGQVYVSPLDLNIEHGRIEVPDRPVIRFATPIADRRGEKRGLLVINLHADFVLAQVQEMAGGRGGVAYLFDRAGFYLSRSSETGAPRASPKMESVEALAATLPRALLARVLSGEQGTEVLGDSIVAFAPIAIGNTLSERSDSAMAWSIALGFPRARLFEAVFNVSMLYGLLSVSVVATAVAGFVLSRHLLRPLTQLSEETEAIARGNFARRVEIRGHDEIADLGLRFNAMAGRLEQSYRALEDQKGRLEEDVRTRTMALERERRHLATVIESTADGILALGPDGRIELANSAAERLLGTPGRLAGRYVGEVWGDWERLRQQDRESLAPARRIEVEVRGRTLSLAIARAAAEGGGHIVVVRDMSEERRLQDAQRELDRQMFQMEKMTTMGELAMGLAHEIGNPLAGMKAVVQLLQNEKDLSGPVRDYLDRIHGEVDRLSGFLHTFHGFAAPQETHPVNCSLQDALEDVLLWTRKEAKGRGVTIICAPCAAPVPHLWADPNQLRQVLLNLLINAIHAMPAGGTITIGMGPPRAEGHERVPRMRFSVGDTGGGIPAEVLPKIFDPFFTTKPDGSGLGLAVVRKIAMQHGADIRVESAPGTGTCFELEWPVAAGREEEALAGDPATAPVGDVRGAPDA